MARMDAQRLIESLRHTTGALTGALTGLSPAAAAFKPGPKKWSVVEVTGHLLEEERTDFRPRLERILADASAPWRPIDPERAVLAYAGRGLDELRDEFLAERTASLAWLEGLYEVDWNATHEHAALGPLTAGDLLTSWAVHDVLHLRQIAGCLYRWCEAAGPRDGTRYAGPLL